MTKRLVDIDEDALTAAQAELGARTMKDTVNEALRLVGRERKEAVSRALDVLAAFDFPEREDAWR